MMYEAEGDYTARLAAVSVGFNASTFWLWCWVYGLSILVRVAYS
jgi:hypothetical protein